ncbi:hypothetical protein MNBD_GAMMA11-1848 [hydrothermal vent metagenome]|uniref:Uncharacterized protein n=1 Tax=hydrothermal vent metagenome TaxID=652676 RepID=A0A3B0WXG6_9ZZZZ
MNKQKLLLTAVLLSLSTGAFASSWSCRHNDNVREIHVEQSTSAPVPCSVVYRKLTEGVEDEVLWTAENDAGYCEDRAQGLVEKQTAWGWTCVETLSEKNSDDETLADETAAESVSSEPEPAPAAEETQAIPAPTTEAKQAVETTDTAAGN